MKKWTSLFLIIASLAVVGWLVFVDDQSSVKEDRKIRVGESEVVVEIADEPVEWAQGLSGRESLGESEGMLFLFPESRKQSFWMKEMKFDLDMLFIDERKVVEIHENVPAPVEGQDGKEIKVQTKLEAEWVLEVNAGWVEKNGVEVGDDVVLIQ